MSMFDFHFGKKEKETASALHKELSEEREKREAAEALKGDLEQKLAALDQIKERIESIGKCDAESALQLFAKQEKMLAEASDLFLSLESERHLMDSLMRKYRMRELYDELTAEMESAEDDFQRLKVLKRCFAKLGAERECHPLTVEFLINSENLKDKAKVQKALAELGEITDYSRELKEYLSHTAEKRVESIKKGCELFNKEN